jgi:hypothetical protein
VGDLGMSIGCNPLENSDPLRGAGVMAAPPSGGSMFWNEPVHTVILVRIEFVDVAASHC